MNFIDDTSVAGIPEVTAPDITIRVTPDRVALVVGELASQRMYDAEYARHIVDYRITEWAAEDAALRVARESGGAVLDTSL